jgi:hypothetical protein
LGILIKEHDMEEKTKVIITRIEELPDYCKKGYNPEQIINISNTPNVQQDQNAGQAEGDGKNKEK